VIALCPKDQPYGLYLLAPLPMIYFDAGRKRRAAPNLSWVRSLWDRKYLWAVLLGAGLFALLHNFAFNFQGFLRHVSLITGGASESYRIFPHSISGEIKLLGLTVRQIQGSLGWPLFFLCLAGLAIVLVRKKESSILRSLPVFALSYYLTYIALILFNCDRYNLPLCLLLSFFGGRAISAIWDAAPARFRSAEIAILAIVFVFSAFSSLSVDALMIADSRYGVERWMDRNIPSEAVIGLAGPVEYAPRQNSFHWVSLPLSLAEFQKGPKPDYIVFASAYGQGFAEGTPEREFFSRFAAAGDKYKLVLRSRTDLPWLVVRYRNVGTNVDAINPEIQVYKRSSPARERRP